MKQPTQTVRVRFAPSPTGHLHIGGLRTAFFNFLFARHHGGSYLLRIEDTDVERSTLAFRESQLQSFAWVGVVPDEPIVIQSSRFDEHREIVEQLLQSKKAYKCFCTADDLMKRFGKGTDETQFTQYDRHCLHVPQDGSNKKYVIRFIMSEDPSIYTFDDIIRGTVTFSPDQYDDFIIVRADGIPMYNFVVVVDDAYMGITQVIRGEEHIPNTPKQIALYKACGYQLPQFAHLPMILGPGGHKLSKRDGATSVHEYRDMGYLPHALLNYLARLGWAHGDQEIFSMAELIQHFSLEQVGKKGAIFDAEKLLWVNAVYIKKMLPVAIREYIILNMDSQLVEKLSSWSLETIDTAIAFFKERVHTLREMIDELVLVHCGPDTHDAEAVTQWVMHHEGRQAVELVKQYLLAGESYETVLKKVADELGSKFVSVAQPIRIALIGKTSGPGVKELLGLLDVHEVVRRLDKLLG
jgi:glutamyl-tRNA synthetase